MISSFTLIGKPLILPYIYTYVKPLVLDPLLRVIRGVSNTYGL